MADLKVEDSISGQHSADFGARLKYVREYNGLSQRELAKRAGVPHSSISMIEQGLNSPSINSLAKILGGIPMSMAHFFSCDIAHLNEQVFRAADMASKQRLSREGISTYAIPLQKTTSHTRFERVSYAPGADTGAVPQYSTEALSSVVICGAIELTLNAEVSVLESGDAFSLGATQAYRLRNLSGHEDCIMVICRV